MPGQSEGNKAGERWVAHKVPKTHDGSEKQRQSYARPTDVYVRIRPLAASGGHAHSSEGENISKALEGWSEDSVTLSTKYLFSKGSAKYTFPRKVWAPETTQEELYGSSSLPSLVGQFTSFRGRNVMVWAYGQTGSGKTHTILGTDESLTQSSLVRCGGGKAQEGWGIFPRAYTNIVAELDRSGRPYVLSASALEFYLAGCSDLLVPGAPVKIDGDTHMPQGATVREMNGLDDVMRYLEDVRRNRQTRSTLMNEAHGDHEGSSRSHAALIMYLCQLDPESNSYCRKTFTLVDLAGAERPSKTKEKRYGGGEMIAWMKEKGMDIEIGHQALLINYELSMIATEVLRATEMHRKKKRYQPPRQCTTDVIRFLGGCFDGNSITTMLLCLSPANVNGWETWYSLQYGTGVSKLMVPVRIQKPIDAKRALDWAKKEAQDAEEAFSRAPKNKYYETRRIQAQTAMQWLNELEMLLKKLKAQ